MKKQYLILVAVLATAFAATGAQAEAFPLADADFAEYWMTGGDAEARNVIDRERYDADYDLFEVTGDPDRYPAVELAFEPILDADIDMGFGETGSCTVGDDVVVR